MATLEHRMVSKAGVAPHLHAAYFIETARWLDGVAAGQNAAAREAVPD
jgi:hypothetical protein